MSEAEGRRRVRLEFGAPEQAQKLRQALRSGQPDADEILANANEERARELV